jgi:hypothetical protein
MPADPDGPFVAMAVLCDRIEPKPDGTVDVFGIVDGVVLTPEVDDPDEVTPAAELSLTALVSLKAGSQRGRHEISLEGVYPSGGQGPRTARLIEFTDDMPGASFIVPLELHLHEPGLYAFDVRYDGTLLTRVGLQVFLAAHPPGAQPS